MKKILLLAFAFISILKLNAQSQCGTDEYDAYLKSTNPTYAAERQKMEQDIYTILKNKQNNPNARIGANDCTIPQSGVYTLPVVVHVIHKGEAIGTGFNISDAQIQGAIQGMNERWRRIQGDGVDLEVQFALAVRDTNNNATNGITRFDGRIFPNYAVNGSYSVGAPGASAVTIMDSTVWDRSKYINIWVVDLRDACGFSSLGASYTLFMQNGCMSYNSATLGHEMGHTFGLHHTFAGDGSGSGLNPSTQCPPNGDCLLYGDWVCDTPPHRKEECSVTNCTTSGDLQNSFKNYMSYCGGTRFTQGQKDRVRTSLYSDNFWSLVMSDGLMPVTTPLEVGIVSVENNLTEPVCNGFIPKIKIKNSGNTTITSLKIDTYVDGSFYQTTTINTNLIKNNTQTYSLQTINFNSAGQHDLYFSITEINGNSNDYSSLNNQICKDVLVRNNPVNTFCLNLEDNNVNPIILDTAMSIRSLVNISGCSNFGSKALAYLSFDKNINRYEDYFYLPYIKLDSAYKAYVRYNFSYKKGNRYIPLNEEPYVYFQFISSCDSVVTSEYTHSLYSAITVDGYDSINPWRPTSCDDWGEDVIDLRYKIGNKEDVLIKVNVIAHYSQNQRPFQNLYFDNFCLEKYYKIDITGNFSTFSIYDVNFSHSSGMGIGVYGESDTVTVVVPSETYNHSRGCMVKFKHWEENGQIISNNPSVFISISKKNHNLKAVYDTSIYLLRVRTSGTPQPSIQLDSLVSEVCANTLYTAYPLNTNYYNAACYMFKNWTENGTVVSTNANYTFRVTANRNLVANFDKKRYTIAVSSDNITNGTVVGSGTFGCDTTTTVTATPASCYTFTKWTENGSTVSTNANYSFTVNRNRTLKAIFEPKRYNITLVANPTNGGTISGAGNFACDSSITVNAKIKPGFKFTNWTEGTTVVSTDSNYTFLISGARSLKANFSLVTGIKQTTINEISKIYPNPANEILQIEIRSKQNTSLTLNIIDMKGSLLETKTINNMKGTLNTSFDVSNLAKGNYLLNLYDEEGMASYKFVVQ